MNDSRKPSLNCTPDKQTVWGEL